MLKIHRKLVSNTLINQFLNVGSLKTIDYFRKISGTGRGKKSRKSESPAKVDADDEDDFHPVNVRPKKRKGALRIVSSDDEDDVDRTSQGEEQMTGKNGKTKQQKPGATSAAPSSIGSSSKAPKKKRSTMSIIICTTC